MEELRDGASNDWQNDGPVDLQVEVLEALNQNPLTGMKPMNKLAIAAFVLAASTVPAFAAGPDGKVPQCDDGRMLASIEKRFSHADRHLLKRGLAITAIAKVHQHRFQEKTERSPIARRYCGATAHMNDGRKRTLFYLIEDGMGFAGYGDHVEFCVNGLDPLRAYGGHCRVIR
jgi:hypothetical protein